MRFRCRYGVRGGRKEGAVPRWRVDFQKTVGAARASPSLIGGLCPAAILSAAPRMQTTLLVGQRPKRDSFGVDFQGGAQESPRTSFSVAKKKKKKEKNVKNLLFFKNHEKILKIKKINEGKKKEGSKKKKAEKFVKFEKLRHFFHDPRDFNFYSRQIPSSEGI